MKKKINRGLVGRVATRLLLGVLLLCVLGSVLTSCGGSGSKEYTTLSLRTDYKFEAGEDNGLNAAELELLAKNIASNKNAFQIREGLVAALNGYNLYAADFDDSRVPLPGETLEDPIVAEPERAPEFALVTLKKAEFKFDTSNLEEEKNGEKVPRLTAADIRAVVDSFKTEVETTAEYGLIDQLLRWIGIGFGWMIDVPGFGSFILGTLYYAILLEILMLPLGIYQQKNSRKQAMLRPREMAIRNKYKGRNDPTTQKKVQEEIQNLYAKEGYSPMSGCLPLLVTMPFLIFLYYIVIDPMIYMMGASKDLSSAFLTFANASRAAGGLGLGLDSQGTIEVLSLIKDHEMISGLSDFAYFTNGNECLDLLSGMVDRIPDFSLLGINMGLKPELFQKPYVLMLIPVLTFVVYWGSGKISRKFTFQPMQQDTKDPAQGCSNGMMNIMMPAMSAFFAFLVPAAVGIYWMFKSVLGTAKQIIISKVMPLPVFSEEDYKAAERELAGKDKGRPHRPTGTRNPNVRSLHHIDDEDYETPSPADRPRGAAKPDYVEPEEETAPRTADTAYSEGVTIKEEDDRPTPDRPEKKKRGLFGRKKDE